MFVLVAFSQKILTYIQINRYIDTHANRHRHFLFTILFFRSLFLVELSSGRCQAVEMSGSLDILMGARFPSAKRIFFEIICIQEIVETSEILSLIF